MLVLLSDAWDDTVGAAGTDKMSCHFLFLFFQRISTLSIVSSGFDPCIPQSGIDAGPEASEVTILGELPLWLIDNSTSTALPSL